MMARVIGGIGISHTPSMGREYDRGMREGFDPRWQLWFDGTRPVKEWIAAQRPDQIVIVYNDHLNHFTFDAYPTFAIGIGDTFAQADEGWGVRPFSSLPGDPGFGLHVTRQLMAEGFDLTVCQEMAIDHGIYSWLPYLLDQPWPVPVLPIEVNMIRPPLPSSRRIAELGRALRRAIEVTPGDARVLVVATGGMSHQIHGARFGMANKEWDRFFLDRLQDHADELIAIPQEEIMAVGGTDAVELVMWFGMRAALSARVRRAYDFYTFPQITGCGVVVFEDAGGPGF